MSALCPPLAAPVGSIVTVDNVDSLVLSNYSRHHGTTVKITCHAAPHYVLKGPNTLTCLNTSKWDQDPPKCIPNVRCPQLAPPRTNIITIDNIKSLYLSTDSRIPGTVVDISCQSPRDHVVKGETRLTCLTTGRWDHEVPTCVPKVTSAGGPSSDLTMVPVLVSAGIAGALVLIFVAVMIYINCCWNKKESCCRRSSHKPSGRTPIGLFRLLGAQEADRDNRRLRHGYPSSEDSDFLESVSTRDGPRVHVPNSPARPARNPLFHDNRGFRGDEFLNPPYITGRHNQRPGPHTSVGSGRSYRTWHDLFYP